MYVSNGLTNVKEVGEGKGIENGRVGVLYNKVRVRETVSPDDRIYKIFDINYNIKGFKDNINIDVGINGDMAV